MRMLLPTGRGAGAGRAGNAVDGDDVGGSDDVDPADVYGADPRPPVGDRPWVVCNMIASIDGAATDPAGRSGGLGGPSDLRVFSAIRAVADIVLAGAGTVRTERYGPARLSPAQEEARRARGQSPRPRIAVVTRSLALEPELPLFRDATDEHRPIVITTTGSLDRGRSIGGLTETQELATVAEVIVAGDDAVDWDTALRALRTTARAGVVLVEGGPRTNAQLLADDLVDELCLTVSPQIVATDAPRIVNGVVDAPRRMTLDRVLVEDDHLFLRYLRARDRT